MVLLYFNFIYRWFVQIVCLRIVHLMLYSTLPLLRKHSLRNLALEILKFLVDFKELASWILGISLANIRAVGLGLLAKIERESKKFSRLSPNQLPSLF